MRVIITQVGSAFITGGINTFIFELANALIKDDHEVFLISGREVLKRSLLLKELFNVERLPKFVTLREYSKAIYSAKADVGTLNELLLWSFKGSQLINKIKPDIIIVNGAVPLFTSAFKVIVCHDLEFRGGMLQRQYNKILYKTLFDVIAATSTELTYQARYEFRVPAERVVTIPICIDTRKYSALPIQKREHAILHVGTWSDKNLETTLKAFTKLSNEDRELKLYIVGDLWERPAKIISRLRREVFKRIYCLGRISKSELMGLYSRVKATSVPSVYRVPVLSPTVLESLASGTPVVGSSTAISRDLLINGYTGFRVHPADFNTIAEKISILIANNKLWSVMSINGRNIAKKFDAHNVARKYVQLYESLRDSF
jgi:glycosyltransferase involved in cell wall biosynthesis